MTKFERWLLYVSNALVGGTGLVYAWMRYALVPVDEYSVVNHAWQPFTQHAHIVLAPLLVIAFGHMAWHHALIFWKSGTKEGKRSGLTMLAVALPMIFSGYLLQTSVSDLWRQIWIGVHLITSALWLLGYLAHLFTHSDSRKRLLGEVR